LQTRLWIILGLATTFMSTSYSIYISKLIPQISAVSFAWRWLVITAFCTALLVGAAIDHLQRNAGMNPRLLWLCRSAIGITILLCVVISVQSIIRGALLNPSLSRRANHTE